MGYLDKAGLSRAFTKLKTLIDGKADVGHIHTKDQVGLGNVDNTADSTKSVKYAASAGSASKCNNVIYTHQNEINFSGGKQRTCYFNYRNADSDASDGGTAGITYKFCNYTSNTAYSTVEANNFNGNLTGKATSAGSADTATKATSADSATRASTADIAIEIADYNNTNQGIKIGYAGDGFTSADFQYALGMNSNRKIKDVSKAEYRKWLGLGSAAYTSSGAYAAASHSHTKSQITDFPTSMPASDVYSWAKQSSKPSYSASEVGAVPTSRKVNGKALSSDISLSAGDVGAAPSSHSHNYAGSSSAGGSANWANGSTYANYAFSNNGVSTSGSGSAYTATVSGFSLATGKSIVMIPHVTSTTTTPTLNVSGTGAKNIRMRLSSSTSSTIPLIRSDFLTQYKPVKVTYDGTYWVIDDFVQPDANNLYGTLISRGSSAPSNGTAGFIYIQTT